MIKSTLLAVVVFVCLAMSGYAALDSMQLISGNPTNYTMGNVYTSPYSVSVNNGTPLWVICDDFSTDISINQTWTATETALTSIPTLQGGSATGVLKFDQSPATAAQQLLDYETVAYLASELILGTGVDGAGATNNQWGNEIAGELSYAIWGTFDTALLTDAYQTSNPPNSKGILTATQLAGARQFLAHAQAAAVAAGGTEGLPNVTIYTPSPVQSVSQEFLGFPGGHTLVMAEPSAPLLLGFNLFALLGGVALVRRRKTRNQ